MSYRLALIGLGAAARNIHLRAYAQLDDLQVVGGYDPQAPAAKFPFPLFPSVEALLAETGPDIVAIASPPDSHHELACAALEAGCHVFCEKPFVESLAQADDVIARAAAANRRVVVNNEFRYMNIHRLAKGLIGTERFGELVFLSAHQTFIVNEHTEAGWRGQSRERTCKDFGPHVLDLCRFFFDEEPASIYARMPKPGNADGPDYLNLLELEFSGDRVAHITLDRLSRGRQRYLDTRLDGTEATLETSIGGQASVTLGVRSGRLRPYAELNLAGGGQALLIKEGRRTLLGTDPLTLFASATAKLMRDFLKALANGTRPPCDAADNRHTLALMLAAYESHRQRAPVALETFGA